MSSKAEKTARRILRKHKQGRAWRTIAAEDYGGKINHATLHRFAKSLGAWQPKDEGLQIVLGLRKPRKVKGFTHTPISEMATAALRKALMDRTEMPPVDPRIIKQFERLGWLQKRKSTR